MIETVHNDLCLSATFHDGQSASVDLLPRCRLVMLLDKAGLNKDIVRHNCFEAPTRIDEGAPCTMIFVSGSFGSSPQRPQCVGGFVLFAFNWRQRSGFESLNIRSS